MVRRRSLGHGRPLIRYLYTMQLHNGQIQVADADLARAVQETHPLKACHFFFNLYHSNRMRNVGVRIRDGFLGPDGITNVPGSRAEVGVWTW